MMKTQAWEKPQLKTQRKLGSTVQLNSQTQTQEQPQANPQGKGTLPELALLERAMPSYPVAKDGATVILDYLVGMFVLSAKMAFLPVAGRTYYLYLRSGQWTLSMVSPKEWGPLWQADYAGACARREDGTWTFNAGAGLASNPEMVASIGQFKDNAFAVLDSQSPLREQLPFYAENLSYYPRVMAWGLSRSLQHSLDALPDAQVSARALLHASSGLSSWVSGLEFIPVDATPKLSHG